MPGLHNVDSPEGRAAITASPIPLIGLASDTTPAGVRHTAVLLTDVLDLWVAQEGGTWRSFTALQIGDEFVDLRDHDSGLVTRLVLD